MKNRRLLKNYLLRENDSFYMSDDWMLPISNISNKIGHTHDFYEFFIVTNGQITQQINEEVVVLSEKEIQILTPRDCHAIGATYEKSKIRNIAIDAEYFDHRLSFLAHKGDLISKKFSLDTHTYNELIEKTDIAKKHINDPQIYNFIMQSVLDTVLIHACIFLNSDKSLPFWLKRLCEDMKLSDNYIAGLPRMLELSHKTQGHLNRSVKKYFGVTVTEYINSLRLDHAAKLLRTTDKKIVDIALESGFESVPYFNKIFKQNFLVTPHVYRNKCIF